MRISGLDGNEDSDVRIEPFYAKAFCDKGMFRVLE